MTIPNIAIPRIKSIMLDLDSSCTPKSCFFAIFPKDEKIVRRMKHRIPRSSISSPVFSMFIINKLIDNRVLLNKYMNREKSNQFFFFP